MVIYTAELYAAVGRNICCAFWDYYKVCTGVVATALRNHNGILLLACRIYRKMSSFQLARVQDTLNLGEVQNNMKKSSCYRKYDQPIKSIRP